ncbi:hypothetical protein GCM10023178_11790 [Actinomadura luteofluorescens]
MRDGVDPRRGFAVALLGVPQEFLGLVAELVQVGTGRQIAHDVSLVTPWSACGAEEIVIVTALRGDMEVDSVLPADPVAPSLAGYPHYTKERSLIRPRSAFGYGDR